MFRLHVCRTVPASRRELSATVRSIPFEVMVSGRNPRFLRTETERERRYYSLSVSRISLLCLVADSGEERTWEDTIYEGLEISTLSLSVGRGYLKHRPRIETGHTE